MYILDIKIVDDAIFVADGHKLVSWRLKTGEQVHDRETAVIAASAPDPFLTLSDDCSEIAFADNNRTLSSYRKKKISLYNVQTQRILCSHTAGDPVEGIRFSPDGRQLWFATCDYPVINLVKLERGEDGEFVGVTKEPIGDRHSNSALSWANIFSSHALCCGGEFELGVLEWGRFEWVMDSWGNKLLWLPIDWRVKGSRDLRWDGNFLAFVGSDYPGPIVIEIQP